MDKSDFIELEICFHDCPTHQVRNFGEALFKMFHKDRKATIGLDHVDQAIDKLVVRVFQSKRNLRRVRSLVEELLEQDLLDERATLRFLDPDNSQ